MKLDDLEVSAVTDALDPAGRGAQQLRRLLDARPVLLKMARFCGAYASECRPVYPEASRMTDRARALLAELEAL